MPPIESIPSPRRLMKSLRDMGYDFAQAVADVVDNSIEASATEIKINVEFNGDDSWVRIADNGTGMRPDVLKEAMRYGSEREYEEDDLGKFGLGLKTASMSQCRRLTVASRWHTTRADVNAYAWDLEHIESTNRWEILTVSRSNSGPGIHQLLRDYPGTVVLWQRLDRILGYKYPYGEAANRRLAQMCRDLEQHLGMVMHRFLSGEARRKIRISVNGNDVQPWDPFWRSEQKTDQWPAEYLKVNEDDAKGTIRIEPFILPHQSDFSSPSVHKAAAGPSGWNQQQGFYVYRANRLIQSGGWSRLRAPDEHTKLARVAISFSPRLDEAFKVNVAKMRVQIPNSVREDLANLVKKLTKAARKTYDRKEGKAPSVTSNGATPSWGVIDNDARDSSAKAKSSSRGAIGTTTNGKSCEHEKLSLGEWRDLVLESATSRERPHVRSAIERLANRRTGPSRGARDA